jgi:endonuclease III
MDRQTIAEKAWSIPYMMQQRLGSFEFSFLLQKSEQELEDAMLHPHPLHRFNKIMATSMYAAIHRISDEYDGNARTIWAGRPSSRVLVHRFLEFRGVGPKIANMAANILHRDLRVDLADCSSIDISADVQVTRVYSRMGFVPQGTSIEDVIYRAREMHPEYPGVYDLILWDLGRTKCRPQNPTCTTCEWAAHCAYANGDHALPAQAEANMRLVIIGCGKSKIWDRHPEVGPQKAEDVYTSSNATVKKKYARSRGCDWMILSGKYGFIRPDFVIPNSYDVTFNDASTCPISVLELKRQVEGQGLSRYDEVTVIGGPKYIERTRDAFAGMSVRIDAPFEGYSRGQQMHMMSQDMSEGGLAQRGEHGGATLRSAVSPDRRATDAHTAATVNADIFRRALRGIFDKAKGGFVDVTSGELYRMVGGRTGREYRMATCCSVMIKSMHGGDTILAQPPKGKGATLTIRYILPR